MNQRFFSRLGKVIRYLRITQQMTQNQLSYFSGLHRAYIGHVERGEKNLTINSLKKIADALHTTPSSLLAEAEHPEKHIFYLSMTKRVIRGRKKESQ